MKNTFLVLLLVCSFVMAEGWLTNLEKAKEEAAKTDKDILIDFTGSDWCGWCIKLKQEVFDQEVWKKEAPKKYVLVEIDAPRKKVLPKEIAEYNRNLLEKFEVEGYPTICLLDKEGKIYARTGYQKDGPEKYLEHLAELAKTKVERDDLLAKANSTTVVEDKIQYLSKALELIEKNEVGFAYVDLKESIVALDSENKNKLNAKYSLELYRYYHEKKEKAKEDTLKAEYEKKCDLYMENLKKHSPSEAAGLQIQLKLIAILKQYFQVRDWANAKKALEEVLTLKPEGEAAQQTYYLLGAVHYEMKDIAKSVELLEKSIEFAPESDLAMRMKMIVPALKKELEKQQAPKDPEKTEKDPEKVEKNNEAPHDHENCDHDHDHE